MPESNTLSSIKALDESEIVNFKIDMSSIES